MHTRRASRGIRRGASIYRAACGDRPDLLDAVAADTDTPVVEVDGRVAVAGDQPDVVAEPEPVGGGRGSARNRRHEDIGAALRLSIDPARRLELGAAGA